MCRAETTPQRAAPFLGLLVLLAGLASAGCSEAEAPAENRPVEENRQIRLTPDLGPPITRWVLSLGARNLANFLPTQRDIILASAPGSEIRIVYSTEDGRRQLTKLLQAAGFSAWPRISWQRAPGVVPYWTRDLFLVGEETGQARYLLPHPEHYDLTFPTGLSSQATRSAVDLLSRGKAVSTTLRTEGGAIVVDPARVFVTSETIRRALYKGDFARQTDALEYLTTLFGLPVVVLETPDSFPVDHTDLFLSPAGRRRVVLGDPTLAVELLGNLTEEIRETFLEGLRSVVTKLPGDKPEWTMLEPGFLRRLTLENGRRDLVAALDGVHRQLTDLGYEVVRVPFLTLHPLRTNLHLSLSYNNVVQEMRPGGPRVYLPTYRLPALDQAATDVWRKLGYEVVPIDCLGPAVFGGSVRCLCQTIRERLPLRH